MKFALFFILVFVTLSYQQQFQKRNYWRGENSGQQDQPSGIYHQPIIIRNNFNPYTEGQFRGGLSQYGIMLDRNNGESSFAAINPSSVVSLTGEHHDPPYLQRSASFQSPYIFLNYANDHKMLNDKEAHFRQSSSGDDYVVNQEALLHGSYQQAPTIFLPPQQRLFFNALGFSLVPINTSNNGNGLFGLNQAVIITSTVNTTTVTTCVSAKEFAAGSAVTACRRRRRGIEHLLEFDDIVGSQSQVDPSAVEKIETTLTPEDYAERNSKLHKLLSTSKDDLVNESDNNDRDKRQFFARRTLTSYMINTLTSTKAITLITGTTSALNCKPSGFVICT